MPAHITVYCRRAIGEVDAARLLRGVTDNDPVASAGFDYHLLAELHGIDDEEIVDAATDRLRVTADGSDPRYYTVHYRDEPARPIVVDRTDEDSKVASYVDELIGELEDREPGLVTRLRQTHESSTSSWAGGSWRTWAWPSGTRSPATWLSWGMVSFVMSTMPGGGSTATSTSRGSAGTTAARVSTDAVDGFVSSVCRAGGPHRPHRTGPPSAVTATTAADGQQDGTERTAPAMSVRRVPNATRTANRRPRSRNHASYPALGVDRGHAVDADPASNARERR
jgi:hypothetical protein